MSGTRRLYLAGPMARQPYLNHPLFNTVAAALRATGRYEVFSPAEHDRELGIVPEVDGDTSAVDLRKVLGDDLAWITSQAEGIALLPEWINSNGVAAEVATGWAIGIPMMPWAEWIELHTRTEPESMMSFWTEYVYEALRGRLPAGMAVPA